LFGVLSTRCPLDDLNVYQDENFELLYDAIKNANGIFIAVPVYNWSLASVVKNIIEAIGSTVEGGDGQPGPIRSSPFSGRATFL